MAKNKTGRNDPCTCGSGKKYKKCCLPKFEQAQHIRQQQQLPPNVPVMLDDDDDLDELSNSVVDLIRERRFEQAETVCRELRQRYPEMPDWMERTAMLHEARGQYALAASFYRKTLAHTQDPAYADGFEDVGRQYYHDKIREMDSLEVKQLS